MRYETFGDLVEGYMRTRERPPGSSEEKGYRMAMGTWAFKVWKPLHEALGEFGVIESTALCHHEDRPFFGGNVPMRETSVKVRGTPVRLVSGEHAYWIDWIAPARLEGQRWNTMAWLWQDPVAWEIDTKCAHMGLRIWGGYEGGAYGETIARDVFDRFGTELSGRTTRVMLDAGVYLLFYGYEGIIPSLHVSEGLRDAEHCESVLGALRRGKELQELYARMMSRG